MKRHAFALSLTACALTAACALPPKPPAPAVVQPTLAPTVQPTLAPTPTPTPPWRPTSEEVLNLKANFISVRDGHGRVMLSWFWPSLDRASQLEWELAWRAQGVTHVVLCPVMQYPGYWAPGGDWRADPGRFAEAARSLLDDRFVPVLFLSSGDAGSASDVAQFFPGYVKALRERGLLPYVMLVPGFEVVGPGGGWRSADLSRSLTLLHAQAPESKLGVELQPTRATGASYCGSGATPTPPKGCSVLNQQPDGSWYFVEDDDPWRGDEVGMWKSHGGEFVDEFLYETQHGRDLIGSSAWEDRWTEVVDRIGTGYRGWRVMRLSFFEVTGYDYFHGQATDADVRRISGRAKVTCDARGVACTYGNGLP